MSATNGTLAAGPCVPRPGASPELAWLLVISLRAAEQPVLLAVGEADGSNPDKSWPTPSAPGAELAGVGVCTAVHLSAATSRTTVANHRTSRNY